MMLIVWLLFDTWPASVSIYPSAAQITAAVAVSLCHLLFRHGVAFQPAVQYGLFTTEIVRLLRC